MWQHTQCPVIPCGTSQMFSTPGSQTKRKRTRLYPFYCFHYRRLRSTLTQWSASRTRRAPAGGCGWRSPRVPPSVSFIPKRWSFCRRSTCRRARRCWTRVNAHDVTSTSINRVQPPSCRAAETLLPLCNCDTLLFEDCTQCSFIFVLC